MPSRRAPNARHRHPSSVDRHLPRIELPGADISHRYGVARALVIPPCDGGRGGRRGGSLLRSVGRVLWTCGELQAVSHSTGVP